MSEQFEQLVQLPGHLPITLVKGDDLNIALALSTSMSDFNFEAGIVTAQGALAFDLDVTIASETSISIFIPALISAQLVTNNRWFLKIIDSNNHKRTFLTGQITIVDV